MNNNTAIFDSWLLELEMNAPVQALQMEQHWEMFRKELQAPAPPSTKPFFRNPIFIGPVILLATLGSLFLFNHKKEKTNSVSPTTESIQQPTINNSTVADTSPVKKAIIKKSSSSIKESVAIQPNIDSILVVVEEKKAKTLPVKKGIELKSSNSPIFPNDTLRFVTTSIEVPKTRDTFYIQSVNAEIKPPTIKIETTQLHPISPQKRIEVISVTQKKDTTQYIITKPVLPKHTNSVKDSSFILIADTNRYQQLEAILQEPWLKGKLVYIDLWGTRCGPCLEEFKHLPALKERYKGKDLAFLYLKSPYSFDDSKEWKEMVDRYHLMGVNISMSIQFYVEGFWKKYAAKYPEERWYTIPTYLIADRNGRILNFDAPRPSNKEQLFPLLDKLLAN